MRLYTAAMGVISAAWDKAVMALGVPRPISLELPPEQTFDSPPKVIDDAVKAGWFGSTGRVTRADALSVAAVQRGRNELCSIATLPLRLYKELDVVASPLLKQLDPDCANVITLAQTIEDLAFEGISWWRITAREFDGFPVAVRHLDVNTVTFSPPAGAVNPFPSGKDARGVSIVWVDGSPVPADGLIRFDSPNPGLLVANGRAIRRALLLDRLAATYADNPRPLDYFTNGDNPDIDPLDDEEVEPFLTSWQASRKLRATGWIPGSVKRVDVDAPSPAEIQLVELQRQVTLEIANGLGIDPEDLGVSTTSRTYFNAQDRRTSKINSTYAPFMSAITQRLSMGDVTRRGHEVKFDLTDYLKPDPTSQAAYWKTLKEMGVTDADEIRGWAGLSGPAPKAEAAPAPSVPATSDRVPTRTFDDAGLTLTMDTPTAEFSVDTERRTITGLALPYGETATKYGMSYRFRKGSLKWSDISRVKHLKDHYSPIGKAIELRDSDAGLLVKLSVARGAAGDELLSLAEDGVYDGLSVGVDFSTDPEDGDVEIGKDGVYEIKRATLREVSTTAMPAFDSARVTKVAASRTSGGTMHKCEHCGAELKPGVAHTCDKAPAAVPAATPTIDYAALAAAMQSAQKPTDPEKPAIVDPTRPAQVIEPAPYRFDSRGNIRQGSHEFSTDLFAYGRGDSAAAQRVMEFVSKQFDVATTDVNELNPTRNRQDMYVDQRSYRYPVWEAIEKGTLTDITPFTFPKFSSASGLVAAHTETVEPSSGTLVTTSQTVTPTAVSGKAKITRETWDQGGNPQVSNLIWRQMVKGWYEALEAAAVAVLDAASPTQIDMSSTPGLADDDLDQFLTAAFAQLQFVRGGFSMDKMFTQIDLYKALVAAVDGNGRRLYPALGPQNATGSVSSRFASLDINGVTALPAWALAATGTVAASSYLFDSDSVHGWASNPQRLDFNIEVAHVYIGLWGYKATAISDINGVREIVYDPS
ncbi:MAG: phage portal protein [Micromonosporaceae bacterium]|nr:phage portal protein [Micromonosporaceae bacterium]